jgi:hypothetical protein
MTPCILVDICRCVTHWVISQKTVILTITAVTSNLKPHVGFEILTAVALKTSIFCDVMPRSPVSVNRRFGGTFRLHLEGWRVSQARNQHETGRRNISEDETPQNPCLYWTINIYHYVTMWFDSTAVSGGWYENKLNVLIMWITFRMKARLCWNTNSSHYILYCNLHLSSSVTLPVTGG